MNKEEILAKSREENKDKDLYEMSVDAKAGRVAFIAAEIVTAILILLELVFTGEFNLKLLIIDATLEAAYNIYKAIKLPNQSTIFTAIICSLIDIVFIILVVMGLI